MTRRTFRQSRMLAEVGHLWSPPHPKSLGFWCVAVLVLFYLGIHFPGLGAERALTRHEVLAAEPAREMAEGGTWVIQQIAGINRYQKPPFMSWLIAMAMMATGTRAEWLVRMPSLLCGLGTVLVMGAITARHFGRYVGLVAGLMQATFFYVVMQSRLAEIDSALCFSMVLAMYAFWWANVRPGMRPAAGSGGWWAASLVLHVMAAVSFLLKGPLGPPVIYGTGTLFAVWRREKSAFWFVWNPILVVGLNLMASWPLVAYLHSPEIFKSWWVEVVDRTTGVAGRDEPIYFYIHTVPVLLLPWTPLGLLGVWTGLKRGWLRPVRSGDDRATGGGPPLGTFLAAWFLTGFVILSATAWKHKHYIIPMMPSLTPACAVGLFVYLRWQYSQRPKGYALLTTLWLLAGAAGVWAVWRFSGRYEMRLTAVIVVLAVFGGATMIAEGYRRLMWQLAMLAVATGATITLTNRFLTPVFDIYGPPAELGKRMSAAAPAGATLQIVNLGQAHISYYLRQPFARVDNLAKQPLAFENGRAWGVIPHKDLPLLGRLGRVTELDAAHVQTPSNRPEDWLVFFRVEAPESAATQPSPSPSGR